MAQDNKIYVIGHKNPHTDSITSAIGYATYLRAQGKDAVACRIGAVNYEARYLLKRFGFEEPMFLETAKVRMDEIDLEEPVSMTADASILDMLRLLDETHRESVGITDAEGRLVGYAEQKSIARLALSRSEDTLEIICQTPTEYFRRALEGTILFDPPERHLNGRVNVITHTADDDLEPYGIEDRIIVTGAKDDTMKELTQRGAGLLIVVWTDSVSDEILAMAKEKNCAIIQSGLGPMMSSRFLFYAAPVTEIMRKKPIKFYVHELAEDVEKKMSKTRYLSYPVVGEDEKLVGYVTMSQIMNYQNKQIVMVDHNEFSRSVPGIEKARVLEVIDHHRVTDFSTSRPVSFRNEIVGSTSTIIATMFRENQISIDDNLAGLLLGGLLSDTMNLRTPTTTPRDRQTANILAALAGVDLDAFAEEMFSINEAEELKSLEEMILHDAIFYETNGCRIMVGKINVGALSDFVDRYDEVQQTLDTVTHIKGLELGVLMISSALENASILFSSGEKAGWVPEAFPDREGEVHSKLEGIVSRKVQIIPKLTTVVEKYA